MKDAKIMIVTWTQVKAALDAVRHLSAAVLLGFALSCGARLSIPPDWIREPRLALRALLDGIKAVFRTQIQKR